MFVRETNTIIISYLQFGEHAGALRRGSGYHLGLVHFLKMRDPLLLGSDSVSCPPSFSHSNRFSFFTKSILKPVRQTETHYYIKHFYSLIIMDHYKQHFPDKTLQSTHNLPYGLYIEFSHLKVSLTDPFSSIFVATGTAAFLDRFKKTLDKPSSRVIEKRTQLVFKDRNAQTCCQCQN